MTPGVAAAAVGVGTVASVLGTLAVLTVWGRTRYARRLPGFRCRVGPPPSFRRNRARWCLRRTWATWVGDVLLIRSGVLRLWLRPLVVDVESSVTVRPLGSGEVRGLGAHPVALRFFVRDARGGRRAELELAVGGRDADRLVGPFLTAALSRLPDAPREHGG
jgi:hypothetical protein